MEEIKELIRRFEKEMDFWLRAKDVYQKCRNVTSACYATGKAAAFADVLIKLRILDEQIQCVPLTDPNERQANE